MRGLPCRPSQSHWSERKQSPLREGGSQNPPEYTEGMAVIEAHEKHQELIDELIAAVAAYNPEVDRDLIRRAFLFAANAHQGQQRRSGEDFVLHPWGAAKICAQLRLDDETIAAALLHDVVEDTDVELEGVRAEFGHEIAKLVEGGTKLTRVQFQSREQAEADNYRKLISAMAAVVRGALSTSTPSTTRGRRRAASSTRSTT